MKTENLTHGSYKAVREVFCNIQCLGEKVINETLAYADFIS